MRGLTHSEAAVGREVPVIEAEAHESVGVVVLEQDGEDLIVQ